MPVSFLQFCRIHINTKRDFLKKGIIKWLTLILIVASVLDGVLSAKYSLSLAVKSAKILNTDPDLVEKWQAIERINNTTK